jgi:AcrR family transcriptional regulator
MLAAVAEKGFAGATVGEVVKRARVSRQTFYEHFANKEDCFLAAFDQEVGRLVATVGAALGSPDDPVLVRVDRVLAAYLGLLVAEPALARLFMIEIYSAGYAAVSQRIAASEQFSMTVVGAITAGQRWRGGLDARFVDRVVVGTLQALVTERIDAGDVAGLADLRRPLVDVVGLLLDDGPERD